MNTIEDLRRKKLERAVELAGGTLEALADKASLSAAYLSQVRNGLPDTRTGQPKNLGSRAARKIESAIGQPKGWMDYDDETAQRPVYHNEIGIAQPVANAANSLDSTSEAELVYAITVMQKVLSAKRQQMARNNTDSDDLVLRVGKPTTIMKQHKS